MATKIEQLGFKLANTTVSRRLIIGVEAKEKCGKTNFMLTAPDPLVVFDFNNSLEGVIHKFTPNRKIYVSDYSKSGEGANQVVWQKMWKKFREEYIKALKEPSVRSIGIDTSTEQWEICRLAAFGSNKVMPYQYAPVNDEFRNLIYMAYSSNKNLILNHKKKEEYVSSKANPAIANRTGNYIRAGFSDSAYMVQVNIDLDHDPDMGFMATILDCRQNPDIVGLTLFGDDINFLNLGTLIFPDSDEKEWI